MWKQTRFRIQDHSHVGEIRRFAQTTAMDLGYDEILVGKISIVVTELATNIVKHAAPGDIFIIEAPGIIHVLAIDNGRGMNPEQTLIDGFSTGGTSGTGLGAIRRGATTFDLSTAPGKGTVIYVNFCAEESKSPYLFGALNVPYQSEPVSGDSWSYRETEEGLQLLVGDGLGHGLMAHQASDLAVKIFDEEPVKDQQQFLQTLHLALRSTRGAAVSLAFYNRKNRIINFSGVGNVVGLIAGPENVKRCISYNGTLGVQTRKVQVLPYPLDKNSFFLMMSDGISTQAALSQYPGIFHRHPFTVAGLVWRDFGKASDDATVVVFREKE